MSSKTKLNIVSCECMCLGDDNDWIKAGSCNRLADECVVQAALDFLGNTKRRREDFFNLPIDVQKAVKAIRPVIS